MKILFIHIAEKTKFGGAEKWLVNTASGLNKKGHDVVVGSVNNSEILKKVSEKGINTFGFRNHKYFSLITIIKVANFIRKNKFDIIITKRRDLFLSGLAAKLSTKPIVIVRSGSIPIYDVKKHISQTNKYAHGIITNTKTIKNFYLFNGIKNRDFIRVVYNGIIKDDEISPIDLSAIFPGKKVILSIGHLVKEKSYHDLIDAATLLKRKRNDIVFLVLGDGYLYDELTKYAKKKKVDDHVHFIGYKDNTAEYLKACDLFILTSHFEGMASSAMEALAYGKPVIMTNVNGALELTDNGRYAVLIRPGNHMEIAETIERVINNNQHYIKLSQEASNYIRQTFTIESMIQRTEDFLVESLELYNRKK
ncbi:MAG: glycosyltransferase [Bacteroidetes bacterium]|nr:glycosyltransferase [Bacteroidota bacterium]